MPYCTNCGAQVDSRAAFCWNCGTRQGPVPNPTPATHDILNDISDRTACILCYVPVFGIIPAVIFLACQRFRTNYRVRFNAFQGLYLFVGWLIVSSAVPTIFGGSGAGHSIQDLAELGLIACWIYMLVKTSRDEQVKLPVIGDLAARSTHEQL